MKDYKFNSRFRLFAPALCSSCTALLIASPAATLQVLPPLFVHLLLLCPAPHCLLFFFSALLLIAYWTNMLDLVKISDLPNRPHSVRIQVRIIRVWAAKGPDNPAIWYYAAIIMDKHNGVIEARIPKDQHQRVSRLLEEGRLCEIAKFSVKPAPRQYHAVKGDHIISFTRQTTITPLAAASLAIPMHYFDIQRLDAVGTEITDTNKMIDVIGRIAGFSPVRPDTEADQRKPAQMIYLADERGYMLEVTLWRQFVPLFDTERLHEESKNAPVVIICAAVQINEWDDIYNVKAISSTRFYFDKTIPEIARFAASLPPDLPPIILDTEGPPYDGAQVRRAVQQIEQLDPQAITIVEFLAIPVTTYSDTLYKCVASITDLINRYEWHYDACKKCTSRLSNKYCYRCAVRRDDFIDWYKLELRVKDQTGTAVFTALGKVAKIIIGADVKAMVKEQDTTDDDVPKQILEIIGKAYQFTVLPKESTKFEGVRMNTIIRVDAVPPSSTLFIQTDHQDLPPLLAHPTGATTSKALSDDVISLGPAQSPQQLPGSTPPTPPPPLNITTPVTDKHQPSPDTKGKEPAHQEQHNPPSSTVRKRLFSETETINLKSEEPAQHRPLTMHGPHGAPDETTKESLSPESVEFTLHKTQSSHVP
ncbi:Replication protein A 70 kDa DNA-binding subunit A [Rhynchospora pubera]|uniref:Replication protein A 70 kDa DNA-binding subunit A n=1 Tax=Rhynchospora pubera TaxID=906938 RepID=A0AAV8FCK5_9POAL|nr:Replication protein A 70 kDa DNA-binding subunit A [Rhynchospora pubera]